MSRERWMNRLGWLGMVAAILIFSPLAQAQQGKEEVQEDVVIIDSDAPHPTRPWLGLHCFPADAALRAHAKLPEGQGLVVGSVADDSPAMKAGIQTNDILLKAGDQPLKEVSDLVKALENAGEKPLALELLRSGETKTIEVTPGRREVGGPADQPQDRDVVRRWMDRVREVAPIVEGLPERIRIFRPGIPVVAPFPKDLNLAITKEGDAPAKIVVSKGEEQWETTEDKLGELPESVRGHVETFLGKLPTVPFTIPLPSAEEGEAAARDVESRIRDTERRARRAAEEATRGAAEAERRIRDQAGPQVERLGRRIEQLERQLQERLEKLDRLIDERMKSLDEAPAEPAAPAKPAEPGAGPTLPEPTAS